MIPCRWDGTLDGLPAGIDDVLLQGLERSRAAAERRLRARDRGAAAAPEQRPRAAHARGDARALRRPRPRRPARAAPPELEGALPAHADRALHGLDARGRAAVRPVAPRPRPRRRRDPEADRAVDADHRHRRRVGGVDRDGLPRERQLRLPAGPRAARGRPRGGPRRVLGAERLGAAPGLPSPAVTLCVRDRGPLHVRRASASTSSRPSRAPAPRRSPSTRTRSRRRSTTPTATRSCRASTTPGTSTVLAELVRAPRRPPDRPAHRPRPAAAHRAPRRDRPGDPARPRTATSSRRRGTSTARTGSSRSAGSTRRPTWLPDALPDELAFPVLVKARRGFGSRHIFRAEDARRARVLPRAHAGRLDGPGGLPRRGVLDRRLLRPRRPLPERDPAHDDRVEGRRVDQGDDDQGLGADRARPARRGGAPAQGARRPSSASARRTARYRVTDVNPRFGGALPAAARRRERATRSSRSPSRAASGRSRGSASSGRGS